MFIAALVFVLLVTGFGMFYSSMLTAYEPTTNSTYDSFYANLTQTKNDLVVFGSDSSNKINSNSSSLDTSQNMIQAGWSILKAIPNTFNNVKSTVGATLNILVPEQAGWFMVILGAIIGIVMIFAIIKIIFGRNVF